MRTLDIKKFLGRISILKGKFSFYAVLGSLGMFILIFIAIAFSIKYLSFPVVLRFNERQGILLFGERAKVFGVWFSFFALWIFNALLAEFLSKREKFLSYALLMLNCFISLILLVVVITVIFVN